MGNVDEAPQRRPLSFVRNGRDGLQNPHDHFSIFDEPALVGLKTCRLEASDRFFPDHRPILRMDIVRGTGADQFFFGIAGQLLAEGADIDKLAVLDNVNSDACAG